MPIRQRVFVGNIPMPTVVVILLVLAAGLAGCGGGSGESALSGDAGNDSSAGADGNGLDSGFPVGDAAGPMADAALAPDVFGGSGGNCLKLGGGCAANADCCDGDCSNGICSYPACVSDHQACTSNGQCCSQSCIGSTCAPLNPSCATVGNQCTSSSQCCSANCAASGTCQPSSFCGQGGDSCATGTDCCNGQCTTAANQALGTCASSPPGGPANCGTVDGVLCGGTGTTGVVYVEGGLPQCGGACCSRACAPYGPTGVLVCQPASGCHVVGDLCAQDSDCCGSAGLPGGSGMPVTCVITSPATVGVCRNPMGCKPNGDVCKLKTMSCNSSCDCCAGNCETEDTCHQDVLGVPRCSPAQCVAAGGACASGADCCNGTPCVPNPVAGGTPQFVCSATQCVAACGQCTINADCCPGSSCVVPPGASHGACGPCGGVVPPADGGSSGGGPGDGGSSGDGGSGGACALYGQVCTVASDCCGTVPCTSGRCVVPLQ